MINDELVAAPCTQQSKTLLSLLLLMLTPFLIVPMAFPYTYGEHKELGDEAFRAVARRLIGEGYYPSAQAFRDFAEQDLRMHCVQEEKNCYFEELSHLPNQATYGTLNGLSGDHSENPMLLEGNLQDRTSAINQTIALHREYMEMFQNTAPDKKLFGLDYWYGLLAYVNYSHFYDYGRSYEEHLEDVDPGNVRKLSQPSKVAEVFKKINTHMIDKYLTLHIFAERAGGEYHRGNSEAGSRYPYYATLFNAFADHFVEDFFAAGHLVVNRTIASTLINNMSLHTFFNEVGTRVANLRGEIWRTYGDNELNKPERDWERADDYLALHPPRGSNVSADERSVRGIVGSSRQPPRQRRTDKKVPTCGSMYGVCRRVP